MVNAIPEGLHSITPHLALDGADKAIDWYKRAFGAEVLSRMPDPSGQKVWHAALRIGSSTFFLNDAFPGMGPALKAALWIYVDNVDAAWARATEAGGNVVMPLADMFWGDRTGTLTDPFGNRWTLAQHVKDLTPDEMMQAGLAFAAEQAKKPAARKAPAKAAAKKAPPKKAAAARPAARKAAGKKPAGRK